MDDSDQGTDLFGLGDGIIRTWVITAHQVMHPVYHDLRGVLHGLRVGAMTQTHITVGAVHDIVEDTIHHKGGRIGALYDVHVIKQEDGLLGHLILPCQ